MSSLLVSVTWVKRVRFLMHWGGKSLQKISPMKLSVTIAYNVRTEDEVDQVLLEAEKAGGKIIKPGQKVFWGGVKNEK